MLARAKLKKASDTPADMVCTFASHPRETATEPGMAAKHRPEHLETVEVQVAVAAGVTEVAVEKRLQDNYCHGALLASMVETAFASMLTLAQYFRPGGTFGRRPLAVHAAAAAASLVRCCRPAMAMRRSAAQRRPEWATKLVAEIVRSVKKAARIAAEAAAVIAVVTTASGKELAASGTLAETNAPDHHLPAACFCARGAKSHLSSTERQQGYEG